MNRRFPIRSPRTSIEMLTCDKPQPSMEYVEQRYPLFIYGLNAPGDRPISVRIEDRTLTPSLKAVLHYSRHDYQSKGIGNVYREMEEALAKERLKVYIR